MVNSRLYSMTSTWNAAILFCQLNEEPQASTTAKPSHRANNLLKVCRGRPIFTWKGQRPVLRQVQVSPLKVILGKLSLTDRWATKASKCQP